MCLSISTIFSTEEVSRRVEVTRFSTPSITPPLVAMPMAVEPSLMASREYSTWKRRPSGEKVLGDIRELCSELMNGVGLTLYPGLKEEELAMGLWSKA